jgi:putative transposase
MTSIRLAGRTGGGIWTDAHRARHEASVKEMVTQESIEEMAWWLERAAPPASDNASDYTQVVAGIAWHLRNGGGWRALPGDFPPWRTVYGWFRCWCEKGLFDQYMREVACRRRRAAGRRPPPRLCIIDTQAVKCIPVRGPRGYDAGKQVLGRKRVALVDADGNWLAISVVPASVQDRDTLPALDAGQAHWPSLREAIYDRAFIAERCEAWSHQHGMRHTAIERSPGQKGFVVLPRRWVVERSFGWLTHWGRLLRERAGRLDVAAARLACAAALSGLQALRNPMPVRNAAGD